jgi:cytochrome bd-type quinol oxidase subunit 1
LVIAGLFTTDPAAAEFELTTGGQLHVLGAGLGTGLFLGLALLAWRLRRVSEWGSARRRATVLTVVAWLAYLSFSAAMSASSSTGDVDAGIGGMPNRLRMIAFCAWMIVRP